MIRRSAPLKRAGRPLPRRRSAPRRGPAGIPSVEWRNPAYRRYLANEGICPACFAMLCDPKLCPDTQMHKLRAGMTGGYCDPAHTENNGMSSKGRDSSCAPLCRGMVTPNHHREFDAGRIHFQAKYGLDMQAVAASWWKRYRDSA